MPMSPCRYACCLGARNKVLGLLRQRKLLSSREIGRWNPSVFTGISFILMKAFALMVFHTKGWPGRYTSVHACVQARKGAEIKVNSFILKLNQASP